MIFPDSFNIDIYKNKNIDLHNMDKLQLIDHYNKYGIKEGRKSCEITNRNNLISYIPDDQKCLEIGPFDCPVLSGKNVKYFDILSQDKLKERAIKINRINNINSIPYIDYISSTGDLSIINETFDVILSCHSIEHQLDLIKHLNDVSKILNLGGHYVIILPDKRYCFDHFIKETTIADIINMHKNNNNKHSIKSVIEHRVLTCHNDTIRHWNNDHGIENVDFNSLLDSIKEYEEESYIDVHSMQFTPKSFENIINILNSTKYINLQIDKVYNTLKNSNEFFVVLKKN